MALGCPIVTPPKLTRFPFELTVVREIPIFLQVWILTWSDLGTLTFLRVQFLHCQLPVSHHSHHSISSRHNQPGEQLVWVCNGSSSSLAGCSLFFGKKEPRTCHRHTDSRKACTMGRGGFRHMETLGNHRQMHMHTHPSMLHPEIMYSVNAHANIQEERAAQIPSPAPMPMLPSSPASD